MTVLPATAHRMTVTLCEADCWNGRPVHQVLLRRAKQADLAGVSVFRGVMGFGVSSCVHEVRLLHADEHAPCMLVMVDSRSRLERFLDAVDDVLGPCLVTLEAVIELRGISEDTRSSAARGRES